MKPKNLKNQILDLHKQGYTKPQIAKLLNCSKQIVYYHFSPKCKELSKQSLIRHRNSKKGKLIKLLRSKYENFSRGCKRKNIGLPVFSFKEFYIKIISNPTCYITKRKIEIEDTASYQLDHIIPISKGGTNELSNLGLTCKDANQSKSYLLLNDYFNLCKEVLENNGFEVIKK